MEKKVASRERYKELNPSQGSKDLSCGEKKCRFLKKGHWKGWASAGVAHALELPLRTLPGAQTFALLYRSKLAGKPVQAEIWQVQVLDKPNPKKAALRGDTWFLPGNSPGLAQTPSVSAMDRDARRLMQSSNLILPSSSREAPSEQYRASRK
jgi:hypothetical protein